MRLLSISSVAVIISATYAKLNSQRPLLNDNYSPGSSELFTLHRDLVNIESITGNEHAVEKFLFDYLAARNFTVEAQVVSLVGSDVQTASGSMKTKHERRNLYAYRGENRKTRILLSSHMDTVPPFYPYEVRRQHDIWGRGSVDDKGSVATQIVALQELLDNKEVKDGDVGLLFVVGEETGGDGMVKANDLGLGWETVIFGEPTELKLASGHKGNLGFVIKAEGKAAHSGYPWLGVNANSLLIPALAELDKLKLLSSTKYGNSTVNIGRMEGGVAGNVVAETASAEIQIRIAAGSAGDVKKIVLDAVKAVSGNLEVEWQNEGYGPVDIDADVEGFDTIVVNYGTDIPNLKGDHKRYLYGPGNILVAHSDHEHLSASDLNKAVDGYKRLIRASLKT